MERSRGRPPPILTTQPKPAAAGPCKAASHAELIWVARSLSSGCHAAGRLLFEPGLPPPPFSAGPHTPMPSHTSLSPAMLYPGHLHPVPARPVTAYAERHTLAPARRPDPDRGVLIESLPGADHRCRCLESVWRVLCVRSRLLLLLLWLRTVAIGTDCARTRVEAAHEFARVVCASVSALHVRLLGWHVIVSVGVKRAGVKCAGKGCGKLLVAGCRCDYSKLAFSGVPIRSCPSTTFEYKCTHACYSSHRGDVQAHCTCVLARHHSG
jgi:hypothetical protein